MGRRVAPGPGSECFSTMFRVPEPTRRKGEVDAGVRGAEEPRPGSRSGWPGGRTLGILVDR